ncbi:MAG TPA: hypothetical protein VMX13_02935 [Sedimentisphaerales bacterium]|nr:hypothetical protein [Sedimentisphaerales bacterium]
METLQIGPWIVKYDAEATRQAYRQIENGDSDRCDCEACDNFVQVREKFYPEEALRVFDKLGIDYRKEVHLSHVWRESPGWHLYDGSFYFVGLIEKIIEHLKPIREDGKKADFVPVTEHFHWVFFRPTVLYSKEAGKAFAGEPVVEINFAHFKVPRVLEVKEPEIDVR